MSKKQLAKHQYKIAKANARLAKRLKDAQVTDLGGKDE